MRSFSTFSPIGTQGANRTPDVGAKLLVPSVWVREPRLMVPGMLPIGKLKLDASNPLCRDVLYAKVLNSRSAEWASSVKLQTFPAGGGQSAFIDSNTYITPVLKSLPSFTAPWTICWGEWVTAGEAKTNRGAWRVPTTATSCLYHLYGGTDANYRDFTICVGNSGGAVVFFNQNSQTETYRRIVASYDGSAYYACMNGVDQVSYKSTSLLSSSNVARIGLGYDYHRGYIGYFYVFNSYRSSAERIALSNDPMQIWIPA